MAVRVPSLAVVRRDAQDGHLDRDVQVAGRDATAVCAQEGLELGEGAFDRRHVGRVRRARNHAMTLRLDRVDGRAIGEVRRKIVPQDGASMTLWQVGQQVLHDVAREERRVGVLFVYLETDDTYDGVDGQQDVESQLDLAWLRENRMSSNVRII
jgi:hypothetical protein